jgi:exodeoxyribonuclease-1
LASRKDIQQKIAKIFEKQEYEPVTDPDLMIYAGGFFHDKDKSVMSRIHETNPEQLAVQTWSFTDQRLPEMLFRYRARNYPETLNADEQAQWLEHCRARLVEGESGHFTFAAFHAEIAQLRNEQQGHEDKQQILNAVEAFGHELEAFIKQA